jgi:hypothetical protein
MFMKMAWVSLLTTRFILIILLVCGSLQIAIPPFDATRYTMAIKVECIYLEKDEDLLNIIIFMVINVLFLAKNL